jgi:diguanylate cyclase (GGDEF)-like protein
MREPRVALPAVLDRPVRMASVPSYLRDVFERLPVSLGLEADLPEDPASIPLAARQILKLSLQAPGLRLERLSLHAGPVPARIRVHREARWCELGADVLSQGIIATARRVLGEMLDKEHFARVVEAFAFQSSNLEVLRTLTHHMLRASELDQALYVMLSGITSGEALGFNRVALFLPDEERGRFIGSKAIGPADADEAHRIWEAVAYESQTIEQQIEACAQQNFDTRFQQYVRTLSVTVSGEVAEACEQPGPLLFTRKRLENASLEEQLSPGGEVVLAAIQMHGKRRGLVFADNLYSGAQVSGEQMRFMRFYIDQIALIWENLALLNRVEAMARQDALTGVLNRRALEARLEEEHRRCLMTNEACALLVIDLDWFKDLNDTQGHQAGDEALRAVSGLLRASLRPTDAVARFGGDEFVVVLPGCQRDAASRIAARIGEQARGKGLSLSVGVASWPEDCPEPGALLATADANLYTAKRAGRGRACGGAHWMVTF